MRNHHLAILKKPYLDAIIEGRKRIESRFTKTRRPHFGQICPGDEIFLKLSSGPVCATAQVAAVQHLEDLTPQKMAELKQLHSEQITATEDYWQSKRDCRYGVIMWLADVKQIEPIRIDKKDWRAWVVLTEKENFGLLEKEVLKQP